MPKPAEIPACAGMTGGGMARVNVLTRFGLTLLLFVAGVFAEDPDPAAAADEAAVAADFFH